MGSGKTQAAIKMMNTNNEKYMYITPYLSEVERIIRSCPNKNFKQPERYGTKINGIKDLLRKKSNIVTTHALFRLFDDEIIEMCKEYVLIMDEVTDVIEPYYIGRKDLDVLLDRFVYIENNLLKWKEKDYGSGKFMQEKKLCDIGSLAMYGNVILWLFPIKVFKAFKETYVLTYMFDAQMQRYYYDYYGLEYKYIEFTNRDYEIKINIYEGKMNLIGEEDYSLSRTWYDKNDLKKLKNNTQNYFTNILKSKSNNNIWTTFKDYQSTLSGKGYTRGYIPSNMRATNEYQDRTAIVYLMNKFINPYIKQFFEVNGIKIDEDRYALSELLQFIWRSGIRQGKEINIYIPSKRMRNLLKNWIEDTNNKHQY